MTPFDVGGSNYDVGKAVAIQADGKVLVAGQIDRGNLNYDFGIVRYKTDGTLDTTFGPNRDGKVRVSFTIAGNFAEDATGIAVQSDGKIVIVGSAEAQTNGYRDFAIARLTRDGNYDTTFSGDGKLTLNFGANDYSAGVAIQSNGKIVVAGTSEDAFDSVMAVARLNSNGTLDTTFSNDGKQTISFDSSIEGATEGRAIALQTDGKIVLAGAMRGPLTSGFDFAVARLKTDGNLDTTFDRDGKQTIAFNRGGSNFDRANAIAIFGGKIVLAGYASNSSDQDFAVARLNSNGSLDTTFDGDGKLTVAFNFGGNNFDIAYAVKVQADGKIVVLGSARVGTTDDDYAVVRLKTNGSLDTTFNRTGKLTSGLSGDDEGRALAIQANGRIICVGFSNRLGDYDFGVVRLRNT